MNHRAYTSENGTVPCVIKPRGRLGAALLAVGLLASCGSSGSRQEQTVATTTTVAVTTQPKIPGYKGGCEPHVVFSQHRWPPDGAALRAEPDVSSQKIGGLIGNTPIAVDGYIHTSPAYPNNAPPFNSNVWFHSTAGGWVTSAAVRASKLLDEDFNPSGLGDGGPEVVLPPASPVFAGCEVTRL